MMFSFTAAGLAAALLSVWLFYTFALKRTFKFQPGGNSHGPSTATTQDVYLHILPLPNLDWRTEEPLKLRPFKPKYHLTMALETVSLSELVMVDKTYLTRINIRRDLHQRHGDLVINCNASAIAAVNELYTWMTTVYLPMRFPTMFKLATTSSEKPATLRNLVTGEDISTIPDTNPLTALRTLSGHVDTDFLFLLPTASTTTAPPYPDPNFHPSSHGVAPSTIPSTPTDAAPKYHLHAYAGCFPSGFNWLDKFSLPLAAIHTPAVPQYSEKLERSMDRFFATLPPGKVVARKNWTVTTDRDLFKVKGVHGRDEVGDEGEEEARARKERERREVDLSQSVVRCERQTLHRLPKSGALVFAFKTYQYELDDIKAEGSGPEMADAIEGMGKGSAPGVWKYKRADIWGEKVSEYLRS